MKLKDLFEAMAIANVSIDDAKRVGDAYFITHTVDDVAYELEFYLANSYAARFAGAKKQKTWAFSFRIAPVKNKRSRKNAPSANDDADFKLQNFNKGLEFKVLPIIMGYIADFLNKVKPDAFMFAADKDESSRASLYTKIIKRYQSRMKALGYRIMTDTETSIDLQSKFEAFIFIRTDL